jgi:hypothetical protein
VKQKQKKQMESIIGGIAEYAEVVWGNVRLNPPVLVSAGTTRVFQDLPTRVGLSLALIAVSVRICEHDMSLRSERIELLFKVFFICFRRNPKTSERRVGDHVS